MSKNRQNYPKFSPKGQNNTNFRIKIFFGRDPFLRILVQFFQFCHFFEKRKNSHKMGPKPRNYLKITKNIEYNPKLIKKEIEIEFGTYL